MRPLSGSWYCFQSEQGEENLSRSFRGVESQVQHPGLHSAKREEREERERVPQETAVVSVGVVRAGQAGLSADHNIRVESNLFDVFDLILNNSMSRTKVCLIVSKTGALTSQPGPEEGLNGGMWVL